MPIGGERIGSAYIRIYGDGSGLPDDIQDSFDRAEPQIRAAGRRMGEAYAEEFGGGLNREDTRQYGRGLREEMERGIAEGDLSASYFESEDWKRFQGRLRQQFGEAGTVAGESLERRFREAGSNRGLSQAIRGIVAEVNRAQADINAAEADAIRIRDEQRDAEFERDVARLQAGVEAERDALREQSEDRDRQFEFEIARESRIRQAQADLEARIARQRSENLRTARGDYDDLAERIRALSTAERRTGDSRLTLIRDLERIQAGLSNATSGRDRDRLGRDIDILRDRLRRSHPEVDRFNAGLNRLSDTVGRGFGRGSRNNFINFLGGVASGLTNLITLAPRVIFTVGRRMTDAFQSAGGGAAGVAAAVGQLGLAATVGIAGFAALGIAAGGLLLVLGPLAALISGIVAALIGLTATITFGAIAGVVALAGALVPLVAGLGVGVAAVLGMSDAMKDRLRPEVDAAKDALKSLGKDAGDALGPKLEQALDRIPGAIGRLRPAIKPISEALGDLAIQYASALDSDGFGDFVEEVGPFLAERIRDLGDAFQFFAEGLGGFFIASEPLIKGFTEGLSDIAEEFSNYANSAEGRREITAFLADASDSAQSLGRFLGAATGTLGKLLDLGNESGDTIFDDLTEQFRGFTDYLSANPDAVRNFFANGVDVARDIGNAVGFLFSLFDDLDTEETRAELQQIFDALGSIAETIEFLVGASQDLTSALAPVIDSYEAFFDLLNGDFDVSKYDAISGALDSLASGFESVFANGDKVLPDFTPDPLKLGAAAEAMEKFSDAEFNSNESAKRLRESMKDYASTLDDVTGAATAATRATVAQNFAQSNLAGITGTLGLTQRDIINASLGSADALRRVAEATDASLNSTKPADIANREYVEGLRQFVGVQGDAVRADQARVEALSRAKQSFDNLKGSISEPLRLKLESTGIEPSINGLARTIIKYDELDNKADIKKLIAATGVDTTVSQVQKVKDRIERLRETKADLRPFVASVSDGISDAKGVAEGADAVGDIMSQRIASGIQRNIQDVANAAARLVANAIAAANAAARSAAGTRGIDATTGGGSSNRSAPGRPIGPSTAGRPGAANRGVVPDTTTEELNRSVVPAGRGGVTPVEPVVQGKTVDASGWTLVSQTNDPEAVAHQVINELTARTF